MSALNCKASDRGFKRTEILAWNDSNMAGSAWRWSIYLTERKDKTFSLGAKLVIPDDPGYRIPVIYPLGNGAQLEKAIEDLYTYVMSNCDAVTIANNSVTKKTLLKHFYR